MLGVAGLSRGVAIGAANAPHAAGQSPAASQAAIHGWRDEGLRLMGSSLSHAARTAAPPYGRCTSLRLTVPASVTARAKYTPAG